MTISQARASLADVVDQIRIEREPVYLTRRGKPVAALVDIVYLDALRAQAEVAKPMVNQAERRRRLDGMAAGAAAFAQWVTPGVTHPDSASDLYASRAVGL